jgi:hypothetical protein
MRDKKEIKGKIYLYYNNVNIDTFGYDKNDVKYKDMEWLVFPDQDIYNLFSGEEFANMIENGSIIDYDGSLANVFMDDFDSNLGICTNSFHKGEFMVDINTFKEMCKEFKIEVNWANK